MSLKRSRLTAKLIRFALVLFVFSSPTFLLAHEANYHTEDISSSDLQSLQSLTSELNSTTRVQSSAVAGPSAGPTAGPTAPRAAMGISITRDSTGATVQSAAPEPVVDAQLQTATKRGKLMEKIAEKNPEVFLRNVMPSTIRTKLSAASQAVTEKPATLTGTTEVLHIDDFTNPDNSRFEYHVKVGGKRMPLYLAGSAPALRSGSTVQIKGYQVGQSVVATGGSAGVRVLYQPVTDAVGIQRVLFLLVNSPGEPDVPTPAQMKSTIFTGAFQKFYKEQSYGKISFDGDVTNWISVPSHARSVCGAVNLDNSEITNYILHNNIDLSKYDRLVFVVNNATGGCAFVGKSRQSFNGVDYNFAQGWVGYPDTPWQKSKMTGFEDVLSHEMGHELGVMHANSWECSGPSLDTNCAHREYGNDYDMMGYGGLAMHFNGFYKDLLGWIATSSKAIITRTGQYTLVPLEATSGVRVGIIKNPATPLVPPLYVEYRQPIGFDSTLATSSAGLFLNQIIAQQGWLPFPRLLNANYLNNPSSMPLPPGSSPALMPGHSFGWDSHGIVLASVSATPQRSLFNVTFTAPVCERFGIASSDVQSSKEIMVGDSGWISLTLTNTDSVSCAPSTISTSLSSGPSAGVTYSLYPSDPIMLAPGQSAQAYFNFQTSPTSRAGDYVFTVTISDSRNNRNFTVSKIVEVVAPPRIDSVAPSRGVAGSTITLTGSGFATSPASNDVTISGNNRNALQTNVMAVSSTTLMFTIPTTMRDDFAGGAVPTTLGTYYIRTYRTADGMGSNSVPFIVTSSSTFPITVTSPNGGEQWELNTMNSVTWTPYGYNPDINPSYDVTAYLEANEGKGFYSLGMVAETGKASIHWITGDVSSSIAPPGQYYIHLVNNNTGAEDRSDAPFTILPSPVDLKINGLDGPLLARDKQKISVSWTSRNVQSCALYNVRKTINASPDASIDGLPASGSMIAYAHLYLAYPSYITLDCMRADGTRISDTVVLNPSNVPATLSVAQPNTADKIEAGKVRSITLNQSGIKSVSVALYKNDQWKKWIVKDYALFDHMSPQISIEWLPGAAEAAEVTSGDVFKIYATARKQTGTGYVDDKSDVPFGFSAASSSPVITSIYGPTKVSVGENGTWKINVLDATDKLTYGVTWGDQVTAGIDMPDPELARYFSAQFSHVYTTPGIYNPRFVVKNAVGKTSKASVTITVSSSTPQIGSLVVSVSPIPASQNIEPGQGNFTFANFKLDAASSTEDVLVPAMEITNSGSSKDGAGSCQLYDGEKKLNTRPINPSATTSVFTFDNPLTIQKDTAKTLALKCNVWSHTGTIQWGITDIEIARLRVLGVSSGNVITATGGTNLGQKMTITTSSLEVSTDANSPAYQIVAGGSAEVNIGSMKFRATGENITLQQLGLILTSGKAEDLTSLGIYDGSSLVGTATFMGTSIYASSTLLTPVTLIHDTDKMLTLRANFAPVGTAASGIEGDLVRVNYAGAVGKGATSGGRINATGVTSFAGARLFRSFPVVRLDPPPIGNITDGKLLRFRVTANAAGDIGLQKIKINLTTNGASVSGVNVFAYSDATYTTPIAGLGSGGQMSANNFCTTSCSGSTPTLEVRAQTSAGVSTVIQIPAGQSRYFEVRGNVSITAPTGSVTTTLLGDPVYPVGGMGTAAGTEGNFIWSPNATGTSAVTTNDFTNGYMISGLPSVGLTTTRSGTGGVMTTAMNLSSLITKSSAPTITGNATDTTQIGLKLFNAAGVLLNSSSVSVANNRWSAALSNQLQPEMKPGVGTGLPTGNYAVNIYANLSNLTTPSATGTLVVVSDTFEVSGCTATTTGGACGVTTSWTTSPVTPIAINLVDPATNLFYGGNWVAGVNQTTSNQNGSYTFNLRKGNYRLDLYAYANGVYKILEGKSAAVNDPPEDPGRDPGGTDGGPSRGPTPPATSTTTMLPAVGRPIGTITASPCVIGSGSALQPKLTKVCDSTVSWTATGAVSAYVTITGSSPYGRSSYPNEYSNKSLTGTSGSNVPFWTRAGTYTATLYINGVRPVGTSTPGSGTRVAESTITVQSSLADAQRAQMSAVSLALPGVPQHEPVLRDNAQSIKVPITHTLALGWTGPEVVSLQTLLFELGFFKSEATGYFGYDTEQAVMAFQEARRLPPAGIVGPLTRQALKGE